MIKMDPDDVKSYIDNFKSKSDVKRSDKKGATELYEDNDWNVYKITTYDAAKYYGKGTKWCITGNYSGHEERGEEYFYNYIDHYNLDGGYYFYINKKDSGKKYCLLQDVNGRVHSIWDASDDDLGTKNTVEIMLPKVPGVNLNVINKEELLLVGAKRGSVTLVKKALSMGADINAVDYLGDTTLIRAVLKGHHEIVNLLIDSGADVNIKDSDGNAALTHAALKGHHEIVNLLIDAGANINAKSKYGDTALMYAVGNDYIDVAELLINHGADVNTTDEHGYTVLKYAVGNGHNDIAELLINRGAKFESRRKYNRLNRKYLY